MKENFSENELIGIVKRIINVEGIGEEIDEMIEVFEINMPNV